MVEEVRGMEQQQQYRQLMDTERERDSASPGPKRKNTQLI